MQDLDASTPHQPPLQPGSVSSTPHVPRTETPQPQAQMLPNLAGESVSKIMEQVFSCTEEQARDIVNFENEIHTYLKETAKIREKSTVPIVNEQKDTGTVPKTKTKNNENEN